MLVYKWDIFFDIECWIVVQFSLVTEMDAFCFSFWEFETVFCSPFTDFISFKSQDIFEFIANWAVINIEGALYVRWEFFYYIVYF